MLDANPVISELSVSKAVANSNLNSTLTFNTPAQISDTFNQAKTVQSVRQVQIDQRKSNKSPDVPLVPFSSTPNEGHGFDKQFLHIGDEFSDDEPLREVNTELQGLLKQYEHVDFGKLEAINFANAPSYKPNSQQKQNQAFPQTADFLFETPPIQNTNHNSYKLNFNSSSAAPNMYSFDQKGPITKNEPNDWSRNFAKRSSENNDRPSQDDSMSQSKVLKKEMIEKDGFLDF